jgi:DNA-binding MarR family transcriptional regulator
MMESQAPPLFCLLIKNTWQKLNRYYDQRLAVHDLTVQKALLLLEISPESGESPKSLAAGLDLESSSMTGLLDRLEKKGFIERRRDPDDRRGILIYLTPTGLAARETVRALVEELDRRLQEALSGEDVKSFRRMMAIINKQVN